MDEVKSNSEPETLDAPSTFGGRRPSSGSLIAEVIGKCACGKPATILCKRGIAPGKWTRRKKRCEECWKLELPPIPENVSDQIREE